MTTRGSSYVTADVPQSEQEGLVTTTPSGFSRA
jgi:hypothetical protein